MITKVAFLRCGLDKAFRLLTEQAGEWWPADRRHTKDAASQIRIESGGRFFERASDGREIELGVVRVFEPPSRLVLDWYPGTGPTQPTHVEIALTPEGEGTRVTVVHLPGPAGEELYKQRAPAYEKSWDLVLDALTAAA